MQKKKNHSVLPVLFLLLGIAMEAYVAYLYYQECKLYPREFGWFKESRHGFLDWLRFYAPQYYPLVIIGILLFIGAVIADILIRNANMSKQSVYVVPNGEQGNVMYVPNTNQPETADFVYNQYDFQQVPSENMYMTQETIEQKNMDEELKKVQELKAYKELLDSGIINQEEFEKKKREILSL